MEWKRHITELNAEVNDAFHQMHRMEYSSFLKLCTIISPQVQVNDDISRHRTGMDFVSVEMMLHCLVR